MGLDRGKQLMTRTVGEGGRKIGGGGEKGWVRKKELGKDGEGNVLLGRTRSHDTPDEERSHRREKGGGNGENRLKQMREVINKSEGGGPKKEEIESRHRGEKPKKTKIAPKEGDDMWLEVMQSQKKITTKQPGQRT